MECPICAQVYCLCGSLLRTRIAAQTADRQEAEEFMKRNQHMDAVAYTVAAIKHGVEKVRAEQRAEGAPPEEPAAQVRRRFELLDVLEPLSA